MPTYARTDQLRHDYEALSADEKRAFKRAIAKFIEDLPSGRFRKGLRVKGVKGAGGIYEMTWAPNGWATFEYGAHVMRGEPHVIWRRCGTHDIFARP